MNGERVARSLNLISRKLRRFLEPWSLDVLEEAANEALESWSKFRRHVRGHQQTRGELRWGYEIDPDRPVVFKPIDVNRYKLQADLFCRVRWSGTDVLPTDHTVGLRVWSLDPGVVYRENLDSPEIRNALIEEKTGGTRRVMLRYHFDRANQNQEGPRYHLQAGGRPRQDEYCWLHEGISVPRLPFPPLDLVLAVELVVANFFTDDDRRILSDEQWLGALREHQRYFLTPYFECCLRLLNTSRQSLLEGLWNCKWS